MLPLKGKPEQGHTRVVEIMALLCRLLTARLQLSILAAYNWSGRVYSRQAPVDICFLRPEVISAFYMSRRKKD